MLVSAFRKWLAPRKDSAALPRAGLARHTFYRRHGTGNFFAELAFLSVYTRPSFQFCQPQGWALSLQQEEPKYFMSVLTNVDGNHYYCAVLSFNEKLSITPSKPVDEEEENLTLGNKPILQTPAAITHHNIMYAPKCLVLVSRLDYPETFKNCLGTIYTVYIENLPYLLETLIGNILGCIQIPPAGGPQVRFSIGAGDKQALQPPLSSTLPGESLVDGWK